MTELELQAIRERAEKATAGEWGSFPIVDSMEYVVVGEGGNEMVAETIYEKSDADFIASARQDVPNLLAEVERLRTVIEDAISIAEMEHADFLFEPWASLSRAVNGGDCE